MKVILLDRKKSVNENTVTLSPLSVYLKIVVVKYSYIVSIV